LTTDRASKETSDSKKQQPNQFAQQQELEIAPPTSPLPRYAGILKLQHQVGNQNVQRLLAQQRGPVMHGNFNGLPPVRGVKPLQREDDEPSTTHRITGAVNNFLEQAATAQQQLTGATDDYGPAQVAQAANIILEKTAHTIFIGVEAPEGAQDLIVSLLIGAAKKGRFEELKTRLDKYGRSMKNVFEALSDSRISQLQRHLAVQNREQLAAVEAAYGHQVTTGGVIPEELRTVWFAWMDRDVEQLKSLNRQIKEAVFARGKQVALGEEALAIFDKWNQMDRQHNFDGRLLRQFVQKVDRVSWNWTKYGVYKQTDLLDDLKRNISLVQFSRLIMMIDRIGGYSQAPQELPSLTGAIGYTIKTILVNSPAFALGVMIGAKDAVVDLITLVPDLAKMLWEIVSEPGKVIDTAIDLAKQLPGVLKQAGTDFLDQWNQNNDWKRSKFQGTVVGYLAVEIAVTILTAGGALAAKAGQAAAKLAKFAGRFPKLSAALRKTEKAREIAGRLVGKVQDVRAGVKAGAASGLKNAGKWAAQILDKFVPGFKSGLRHLRQGRNWLKDKIGPLAQKLKTVFGQGVDVTDALVAAVSHDAETEAEPEVTAAGDWESLFWQQAILELPASDAQPVQRQLIQRETADGRPPAIPAGDAGENKVIRLLRQGDIPGLPQMEHVLRGQYDRIHGLDLFGIRFSADGKKLLLYRIEVKGGENLKLGRRKSGPQTGARWTREVIELIFIHNPQLVARLKRITGITDEAKLKARLARGRSYIIASGNVKNHQKRRLTRHVDRIPKRHRARIKYIRPLR
jgi:hypothetical protein